MQVIRNAPTLLAIPRINVDIVPERAIGSIDAAMRTPVQQSKNRNSFETSGAGTCRSATSCWLSVSKSPRIGELTREHFVHHHGQ